MSEISMFRKLFVCTQCNTEKFHARITRVFMQELLGFSKTAVDKVKKLYKLGFGCVQHHSDGI